MKHICCVSGEMTEADKLIRFVRAPDGVLRADLKGDLALGNKSGEIWISARQADIAKFAQAPPQKNMQKNIWGAFGDAPLTVPTDLAERVGKGLRANLLGQLGMLRRAGQLVFGTEKITDMLRREKLALVITARDSAAASVRKMRHLCATRKAQHVIFANRAVLAHTTGRGDLTHIGVEDAETAQRLLLDITRLNAYSEETMEG